MGGGGTLAITQAQLLFHLHSARELAGIHRDGSGAGSGRRRGRRRGGGGCGGSGGGGGGEQGCGIDAPTLAWHPRGPRTSRLDARQTARTLGGRDRPAVGSGTSTEEARIFADCVEGEGERRERGVWRDVRCAALLAFAAMLTEPRLFVLLIVTAVQPFVRQRRKRRRKVLPVAAAVRAEAAARASKKRCFRLLR